MGEYSLIYTPCVICGHEISIYPNEDVENATCIECGGEGVRRD